MIIKTLNSCVTGLTLLGFKPRSSLKRYHHVRPAQFIYPDEKVGCCNLCIQTCKVVECGDYTITVVVDLVNQNVVCVSSHVN